MKQALVVRKDGGGLCRLKEVGSDTETNGFDHSLQS